MRLRPLLSWSAVIFLLFACLFFWLTYTTSGLRAVLRLANTLAPVELSHTNLSGTLSDFHADTLSVTTPELTIIVEQVQLRWHPFGLLRKSFQAEQIHIANLMVETQTSTAVKESNSTNLKDFRFPLDIGITDLSVDKLTVNDQVLAQSIDGTVKLNNQQWSVSDGVAQLPQGAVTLSVDVYPQRDWQHALQLTLDEPQLGPAQLVVNGDQMLTQLQATAAALGGNAQLSVTDPFEQFNWNLALAVKQLTPLGHEGSVTLEGSGVGYTGILKGDLALDGVEVEGASIDLERLGDSLVAKAEGLINSWPVTLSAQVSVQGIKDGQVLIGSKGIANQVVLQSADISIDGSWERLEISATSAVVLKEPAQLSLKGEVLDLNSARFSDFNMQLAGGSIIGKAQVNWQDSLRVSGDLNASNVDLQRFDTRLPGIFSAMLSVQSEGEQTDIDITNINASSPAAEGPITGSGNIRLKNSAVQSARLDLSVDKNNHIHINKLASQKQVDLKLAVTSLGAFIRGAGGQANGELLVDLETLYVDGAVSLQNLSVPPLLTLESAEVSASHESGQQQLSVSGGPLVYDKIKLSAFNVDLTGSAEAHAIQGTLKYDDKQSLEVVVDGAWTNKQWRYQVNQFDLAYGDLKAMLESPAQGVVANSGSELSPFCIVLEKSGKACASYQMSGNNVKANAVVSITANAPSVASLLAQFDLPPMEFPEGGELTLDLDRENDFLKTLEVDATIPLVLLAAPEGEAIEIRDVVATARGDQSIVNMNAGMHLAGGKVTTEGKIENLNAPVMDARVVLDLPELSALTALFTDLDLQRGKLDGALAVSGAMSSPEYSGELHVSKLQLAWPSLGTQHEGELHVNFGSGKTGNVRGRLISPSGEASVQGTVQFTPGPDVKLTVVGKQFLIADTADLSVSASPNLNISWHKGNSLITGDIVIDRAFSSLDLPALQTQVVMSNDVVFSDQQQESELQQIGGAEVDIGVEFAKPGKVAGRGIDGDVSGKLRITQKPGTEALANGVLSLTGTYQAFGQSLTIENGQLIYTNTPVNDPVISVYASRKIDDITVGVRVGGRASTLVTRLESTPSMAESDILHYLVLGRAPDASTSTENNRLASAAVSLAISQSEVGVQSIGEKLGITDLGITQEFGALALAVGKQLSPKLYVSYTVGLLEPLDVAKIRYTLSQRVSLEAEVSDETRASLRYRIEKD